MNPKHSKTLPITTTPGSSPPLPTDCQLTPEVRALPSDTLLLADSGQADSGRPLPPYGLATGSYKSQSQDFSREHIPGQAMEQHGVQPSKVGANLASRTQQPAQLTGPQLFLSNLKPTQKIFHQDQVQFNHSASNLRFVYVLGSDRSRTIRYQTPSLAIICEQNEANIFKTTKLESHQEPNSQKSELVFLSGRKSRLFVDPSRPELGLLSDGNRNLAKAASRKKSELSESGSSIRLGKEPGLQGPGNEDKKQASEEERETLFKSVMNQLRERLMNDQYFSIKEFNLAHKRKTAENRVRSALSTGIAGPPADPRDQGPTDLRPDRRRQPDQPRGVEQSQLSEGQLYARPVQGLPTEVATKRQYTSRVPLFRMYSIENNLSVPLKPQLGFEFSELSPLHSPSNEPKLSPNRTPGTSTLRLPGIPGISHSNAASPVKLKTGTTLPTNPDTPDRSSLFVRQQFRFPETGIKLFTVPQEGDSSEPSPDSVGVCQSPELKPKQAGAHSSASISQDESASQGLSNSQRMLPKNQTEPHATRVTVSVNQAEVACSSEIDSVVDKSSLNELITQDKQTFLKLTKAIASVERVSQLDLLSNIACENLGMLLDLRTGNELLQELLRKQHPETISKLSAYCWSKLQEMTSHAVKTKTLFCLAKFSPEFRGRLFAWFGQHFVTSVSSNPSVFLLNSIFKVSRSTEELSPIKDALNGLNPQSLLSQQSFKRFLISYCEYCEESELERQYREWNIAHKMLDFFNDKYKALVLVSFLRRKHKKVTELLLKLIRFQLPDLFGTKFFKLLVIRLCNSDRDSGLLDQLLSALQRIPPRDFTEIAWSKPALYFYLALMLMTGGPKLAEHLGQLDGFVNDFTVVSRVTRSIQGGRSDGRME
jgi:hypothetical protein